jgi:hypothetical protein
MSPTPGATTRKPTAPARVASRAGQLCRSNSERLPSCLSEYRPGDVRTAVLIEGHLPNVRVHGDSRSDDHILNLVVVNWLLDRG